MAVTVPASWRAAPEVPGHPLTAIDMTEVGNGVRMLVELGPLTRTGASAFRVFLHAEGLGRTKEPVLYGLHHAGRLPAHHWVEVTSFQARVPIGEEQAEIPEGIDALIVAALASVIPPGGHLAMEYDSPHRHQTALALAAHVPPEATPLGAMMFSAGCGIVFRDLHTADGGREGPRRLEGMRAHDEAHAVQRAADRLIALEAFMGRSKDLDWGVQATCRPLAEEVMGVLRERLGLGDGPVPLDADAIRR